MGMDKIINNVAPTKKAKVHTRKVCQPWYNNILRDEKTKVHGREMIWQNIKKIINGWHFKGRDSKYFRMLSAIRQQFYSNEFKNLIADTKQLYKVVAKLTGNLRKNKGKVKVLI